MTTIIDLPAVLASHRLWQQGNADGKRANLGGADLTGTNLTDANLRGAYLRGADLEQATLPAGWLWWQGGASGPYRRQMRVWRPGPDAPIVAHQGCIHGSPAEVEAGLQARREAWAYDHSDALADLWLAESLAMLAAGVAYIEGRAALESGPEQETP